MPGRVEDGGIPGRTGRLSTHVRRNGTLSKVVSSILGPALASALPPRQQHLVECTSGSAQHRSEHLRQAISIVDLSLAHANVVRQPAEAGNRSGACGEHATVDQVVAGRQASAAHLLPPRVRQLRGPDSSAVGDLDWY